MNLKNSSFPTFLGIIMAGLIIAGAIIYTNKGSSQPGELVHGQEGSLSEDSNQQTVTENDHIIGNINAPVTMIEFSDFQCPYCGSFHPTVQQILIDYSNQIRFVYKHFPLDQIHPQARPAAEASECAAEQGKFWEFSDGLFENQQRLSNNLYGQLAQNLGLDMEQFDSCVSSRKYRDKVESDYQAGIRAGVRGTPISFVNGKLISGAVSYETLKTTIEGFLSTP